MANIFLKPTAKFKPFSYQEMLAPVKSYTDAYNEADAELNSLMEDAATKAFNFAPQDTAEKQAYDNLMSRLETAAGELSTSGLNPQLAKDIQTINKEYRKVMLPIQQTMTKRAELATEQRELLAKNPNLRFTKDYSTASLKDITGSSTYNIIDLDDLYKTTAQEFSSKTSTLYRDNINPTPIKGTDYYNVTTGFGYTPEEFIEGLSNKNSDVYKFYKNKADAIDNRTDISASIKEEMKAAVLKGMEASSGTFKTSQVKGSSSSDISSKMIKLADNLYELSGALYQYDEDGNLYKVGNKPTSKSTSSSENNSTSESSKKSNSGQQRKPRLEKRMLIKFKNNNTVKNTIYDPVEGASGKLYTFNDIKDEYPHMEAEINKAISGDDPINYTFFVDGNQLHIIPKNIEIVENNQEDLTKVKH